MINGISSMASTMSSSTVQRQPPPPDKDAFKVADSNQDGLVNDTELATILEGIAETTGNTISSDEALSTYDVDGDGGLNGEELYALLSENGFELPAGEDGEAGGPPPPPPPSMEQALTSYAQNSGEDTIQQLIDYLQGVQSNEDDSSSINIAS